VLRALVAGIPINPGTLAREALTVPETLTADDVLTAMRRKGVQEAVVIDEYGGTAGVVTFDSLMERIVGDAGASGGRIRVRPDGSADIDGLTLVTDVNEQFDLDIDEEVFTTVGGYVLGRLGRRARVGDLIDLDRRQMRVDAVDGLRVAKVWLSTPRQDRGVEFRRP
jgi:CBS domain containing-hemolysin-like protein